MNESTRYVIRKRYKDGKTTPGPRTYYLRDLSTNHDTPAHVWTPNLQQAKVFELGKQCRPPVYFTDFYLNYDMVKVEMVTELRVIE